MPTYLIDDLDGALLNCAVEVAEGFDVRGAWPCAVRYLDGIVDGTVRDYAANHAHAGPIMDRERICTEIAGDGWAGLRNDCFSPASYAKACYGNTRLVAGMRCYLKHVFGETVTLDDSCTPGSRL